MGRIFPLLGDVSRSLHIDKQVMKVPDKLRVVEFQYFSGRESGLTAC